MYTTYRLHTDELDMQFLEALKALFEGKTIEIVVQEVDETAYLLGNEANKRRLLQAVEYVANGQNLIEVSLEE